MGSTEAEASLQGQAEIWQYMFSFVDSMALMCAVELRIADIIHSHSGPVTLSQIASSIENSPSPTVKINSSFLERIMRLLVRRRIFTAHHQSDCGESETLYGLTHSSRWLLRDSELSLAHMLLLQKLNMSSWNYFSQCVKEGGTGFKKAHGCELWDYASQNVEYSTLFNKAMADDSRIVSEAVISGYKDGFNNIGSLVDVAGGTGEMAAQIVKSYPHIKAINYDLPHVIKMAPPDHDGVSHLGGDMFDSIPNADAVFLKWILHDWSDKDCIKILKNCRKAIPEETGKLIIVDVVIQPDGNGRFDEIGLVFDLVMLVALGGKERTELEWKKLLEEGGFPTYKIIQIPALQSIIEAYPY